MIRPRRVITSENDKKKKKRQGEEKDGEKAKAEIGRGREAYRDHRFTDFQKDYLSFGTCGNTATILRSSAVNKKASTQQ